MPGFDSAKIEVDGITSMFFVVELVGLLFNVPNENNAPVELNLFVGPPKSLVFESTVLVGDASPDEPGKECTSTGNVSSLINVDGPVESVATVFST